MQQLVLQAINAMNKSITALALMLLGAVPAAGQSADSQMHYTAYSNTAMAVTGDLLVSPSSVTFQNGGALSLKLVSEDGSTRVYAVLEQANPVLLNSNYLCDKAAPATYLLMHERKSSGKRLMEMSVYTADQPPKAQGATPVRPGGFCAAYSYVEDTGSVRPHK